MKLRELSFVGLGATIGSLATYIAINQYQRWQYQKTMRKLMSLYKDRMQNTPPDDETLTVKKSFFPNS
jgi:hypothetical protein